MKKIIRRKITIKTISLKVTKSGAVENGNAHGSEMPVCPVCQTPLALPALPANEVSAVREILVNPMAELLLKSESLD